MTTKKSSAKSDSARSEIRITVADQNREISVETASDRDAILAAVTKSLQLQSLWFLSILEVANMSFRQRR